MTPQTLAPHSPRLAPPKFDVPKLSMVRSLPAKGSDIRRECERYLSSAPVFLVLIRMPEIVLLSNALEEWLADKPVDPEPVILDVACGYGVFTNAVASAVGRKMIGIDISFERLSVAKRRGCFRGVVQADARYLPFKEGAVDVLTCNSAIEHFPTVEDTVAEFSRVTQADGAVMISTMTDRFIPNCFVIRCLSGSGFQSVSDLYRDWTMDAQCLKHLNSMAGWERILKSGGLRPILSRYYLSRENTQISDAFLPLGVLAWMEFKLFRHCYYLPRPPFLRGWVTRLVEKDLSTPDDDRGSCVFFVARPAKPVSPL